MMYGLDIGFSECIYDGLNIDKLFETAITGIY